MLRVCGGIPSQTHHLGCVFISSRSFSCLQTGQKNSRIENYRAGPVSNIRKMSTVDSMFNKLISLPPVHYMEDTLATVHDMMGLPWWATIMLSTCVMRLVLTLPAHITQQKVMAKRYVMSEEMKNDILPALEKATNRHVVINKWSKKKATDNYRRVAAQFHIMKVREYNCHMAKMFLPMYIQIPAWVFTSMAVRNISLMRHSSDRVMDIPVEERFLQMSTEGIAWFQNLTIPDPAFILPFLVGLTFATTIFISSNKFKHPSVPQQLAKFSKIDILLYSVSVLMIPLASIQPAAVAIYWVTSGAMGAFINLLLMSPKFRRTVRIPKIPVELDKPYTSLRDNLTISINKRMQ